MSQLQRTTLESELVDRYAEPVSFGANVKRLRKAQGLQARELAEQLGVKGGTLSDWERDRRGLPEGPTLIRFAKVLGCSLNELLLGVDPEYDEIVIAHRDLPDHAPSKDSDLSRRTHGTAAATAARIQQLEQQLRERDRFINQIEDAALKFVRFFAVTKENRGARTRESGRRSSHRKAG